MAGEVAERPAESASWREKAAEHPKLTIGAIAGALAIAVGVVGDLVGLWDRFTQEAPKPTPVVTVAQEVRVDVPWSTYLTAHPSAATRDSYTDEQLAALGEEYVVDASVDGRTGARAVLAWEVFQTSGMPLALPAWAPRRLEATVGGDGRVRFLAWIAVPDGAAVFYPKFTLTIDGTSPPPTVTGKTLTIAR